MKLKIIILSVFAAFAFASCNTQQKSETKSDNTQTAAVYQCPMDCEKGKTYDKSGKCPVCEMDLEKK